MLFSGGVAHGEANRVPAESGSGEVFTGGGAVLLAPLHRELQTAVDGQPGRRLLLRQTQRYDGQMWFLFHLNVSDLVLT